MNDKQRKLWQQKYHNIIKSKDHIHWLLYTFPSSVDFGVISVYFRHIFFHFKINMNVHFRRTWMCSFYSHADSAWVFPPFSRKFLPFFRKVPNTKNWPQYSKNAQLQILRKESIEIPQCIPSSEILHKDSYLRLFQAPGMQHTYWEKKSYDQKYMGSVQACSNQLGIYQRSTQAKAEYDYTMKLKYLDIIYNSYISWLCFGQIDDALLCATTPINSSAVASCPTESFTSHEFQALATKLRRFSLMAASLALAFPALAAEGQSKSMAKLSWVRLGAAACPRSRIWTNPTPSRRPWPSMELSTYSKLKTESSRDTKNIHHLFRHFQGLINDLGTTWKVKEREATLAYSWQMSPSVLISCCTFKSTQAHTHTHTSTHYNIYNSPSHPHIHCHQQEHNKHRSFGLDGLEDSRDR